jgi:hypothetical protein
MRNEEFSDILAQKTNPKRTHLCIRIVLPHPIPLPLGEGELWFDGWILQICRPYGPWLGECRLQTRLKLEIRSKNKGII